MGEQVSQPSILPLALEAGPSDDGSMNPKIALPAQETSTPQSTTISSSISSPSEQIFQSAFASPGRIFTDLFSGYDSPLSSEILSRGGQVFRVDILINPEMDILSDDFTEQLLRFCASGKSAYIACSPCCGEYSRLKLLPGPGPKPLRTPENLGGVPGLTSEEALRVQNSFLQLSRGAPRDLTVILNNLPMRCLGRKR